MNKESQSMQEDEEEVEEVEMAASQEAEDEIEEPRENDKLAVNAGGDSASADNNVEPAFWRRHQWKILLGVTLLPLLLLLLLLRKEDDVACESETTCLACLNNCDCDAWFAEGGGSCYKSCDDGWVDTSCYSTKYSKDQSNEDICQRAVTDEEDSQRCSQQPNCTACSDTSIRDGTSSCIWSQTEEGGWCSSGAWYLCPVESCDVLPYYDDDGKATFHDTSKVPRCYYSSRQSYCNLTGSSCLECLSDCNAWVPNADGGGTCYPSCSYDAPKDQNCYRTFDDGALLPPQQICESAQQDATVDSVLCSNQTSCASCVATELPSSADNNETAMRHCKWYRLAGAGGRQFCSNPCSDNRTCDEVVYERIELDRCVG